MLGLATARAARHRFHDAIALAQKAAARSPKDADAYTIIGDAYLGIGDLAAAEVAYKEVAARAPGFTTDSGSRQLLHARGKSRDAIALLRQALADATARDLPVESRAWCHVIIGATLFDLGDWTAAEPEYKAALELTPDSYVAIEHLAELRSYQRRDTEALALYDRAIALARIPTSSRRSPARTNGRGGRRRRSGGTRARATATSPPSRPGPRLLPQPGDVLHRRGAGAGRSGVVGAERSRAAPGSRRLVGARVGAARQGRHRRRAGGERESYRVRRRRCRRCGSAPG